MESLSLRERIAMTIATRDPLEDWCGNPINWGDISEGHRECYRRDADAILAIPGIAVVELPEPHRSPPMPFWNGGEIRTDGRLVVMGDYSLTVSSARIIAADLLAAADYAERDQ